MDDDLKPENDALDAVFWTEICDLLAVERSRIAEQAETRNSISFRRYCAVFERNWRIAQRELSKALGS